MKKKLLNSGVLKKAICKVGSKLVTLGSKVIFLGGNFFIFLSSKITFLAAKVGSRNYFFEQQEFIFWEANILVIEIRHFSLFREKNFDKMNDI